MNAIAQLVPRDLGRLYQNYVKNSLPGFVYWVVTLVILAMAVLLAFQVAALLRQRRSPRLLFYDLARMQGVNRSVQRRLLHVARTHKVGDPARLFVCPDLVSRIESLEMSQAANHKERKRLEEFFRCFKTAVFGPGDKRNPGHNGGEK